MNRAANISVIKSNHVLKKIFSLLTNVINLNLIRYNKTLQKNNDKDIEDYKNKSKKYKINEENEIVKEYTIDKKRLIFEGQYSNGKKNGKCKEYYNNGKLKFEGEYLNGKKMCGIIYDINSNKSIIL